MIGWALDTVGLTVKFGKVTEPCGGGGAAAADGGCCVGGGGVGGGGVGGVACAEFCILSSIINSDSPFCDFKAVNTPSSQLLIVVLSWSELGISSSKHQTKTKKKNKRHTIQLFYLVNWLDILQGEQL